MVSRQIMHLASLSFILIISTCSTELVLRMLYIASPSVADFVCVYLYSYLSITLRKIQISSEYWGTGVGCTLCCDVFFVIFTHSCRTPDEKVGQQTTCFKSTEHFVVNPPLPPPPPPPMHRAGGLSFFSVLSFFFVVVDLPSSKTILQVSHQWLSLFMF